MKRILAYILIFTALALIFALPVNAIDRDFGATNLYTLPYEMNIVSGPYTITDSGSGIQPYPSIFMDTANSQVNALYDESVLVLRKSATLQNSTIGFNGDNKLAGNARIYNVFTNVQSYSEMEVTITLRDVPFVLDETTFSIGFNGDIVSDLSFAKITFPVLNTFQNENDIDIWYSYDDAIYTNIDGNIFDDDFWAFCEERIPDDWFISPDCCIIPEIELNYTVGNCTGNISYSLNRYYTEQYDVTVGNHERQAYPNLPVIGAIVPNVSQPPIYVDTDIVSWLGDCVDVIFSTQIFPNITIGTLLWAILGVGVAVMFIKFFAGG